MKQQSRVGKVNWATEMAAVRGDNFGRAGPLILLFYGDNPYLTRRIAPYLGSVCPEC